MIDDQFQKGQSPLVTVVVRINGRQFRKILELNQELGCPDTPVDQTILELLDIGLEKRMPEFLMSNNDE